MTVAPADAWHRSVCRSPCLRPGPGSPVSFPDGSQIALASRIAFLTEDDHDLVFDADGSGDAVPIDDRTYESWRGGSGDCDLFG